MMAYPLANTLVVRKVGDTNRDSTFALLKKVIYTLGVQKKWRISTSPMELEYFGNCKKGEKEGQKIIFRGLDDPMKITSIGATKGVLCWAWFEEAYQITKEADFDMVDQSIRGIMPEGSGLWKRIMITFNPWHKAHWLRLKFFENEDGTKLIDDDIYAITTNYMCNEWLDEDDLKFYTRMKERNPRLYDVAGLGNWGNSEGLIYNDWEEADFDYHEIATRPGIQASYGLDFGFAQDPTAFVAILVDRGNYTVWVYDELYQTGLTNRMLAERLMDKGYRRANIIADSEAPKDIVELQEYGMESVRGCYKFHGSILNGIQRLQDYHIIIHPRCINLLMEIANYSWFVDRNGVTQQKPAGGMDHACLTGDTTVITDRGNIPIRDVKVGDKALTLKGYKTIVAQARTGHKEVWEIETSGGTKIRLTPDHRLWSESSKCFKRVDELRYGVEKLLIAYPLTKENGFTGNTDVSSITLVEMNYCTDMCGRNITDLSQADAPYIISTGTQRTTTSQISNVSQGQNTQDCTTTSIGQRQKTDAVNGIGQKKEESGIDSTHSISNLQRRNMYVNVVESTSSRNHTVQTNTVQTIAGQKQDAYRGSITSQGCVSSVVKNSNQTNTVQYRLVQEVVLHYTVIGQEDVYNITVEDEHTAFFNGVYSHQCDSLRYAMEGVDMGRGGGYMGNIDEDTKHRYATDTSNVPANKGYINGEKPMYTDRHYDEDDPEPEDNGGGWCFST